MPWKAPYRPRRDGKVTQNFEDGLASIYGVTDGAAPGYKPKPALTKNVTLRYEERRLGIQRYYEAQQNQVQIERVIRVPRFSAVSSQDVAVTEDGKQYRVDLVQIVTDVFPASMDLTLSRIDQKYEVPHDMV